MMNGYYDYNYNDNGMNEARSILSQKNVDELKRLINDDVELTKFVRELPEVCLQLQ